MSSFPADTPVTCPWCGTVNDRHVRRAGDRPVPEESASLCWSCRALSIFTLTDGVLALRCPTEGELQEMAQDPEVRRVLVAQTTSDDPRQAAANALGDGTPMPAAQMSVDQALIVIAHLSAERPGRFDWGHDRQRYQDYPHEITRDYRKAVLLHHPDRGGDPAAWQRLQDAKRVLDEHRATS